VPDRLYFTDSDEANKLIATDPMALVVGFVLDQQVSVQKAFAGPMVLRERLGSIDAATLAEADLEPVFREKPAIHRFPDSMARRVHDVAVHVRDVYGGDAARIWTEADSGAELMRRLQALPGFGKQKAQIFTALVAKQLAVRPAGWEQAAGDYALDGYRSVADVVDGVSLQKVREFKQAKKAAAKAASA
jgi:uncharacterized HhH-GPD family protein